MPQYKIVSGDTLDAIARKNNTTVDELAKLNNISDPNKIRAGKTLELPYAQNTQVATQAPLTGEVSTPTAGSLSSSTGRVLTGQEIEQQARSLFDPQYQASLSANRQQLLNTQEAIDAARSDYELGLGRVFDESQQRVISSSVKRGTGRSSITDDALDAAFADIGRQSENFQEDLATQSIAAQRQSDANLAQLTGNYESNILNTIFDLRQQNTAFYQWLQEMELASKGRSGGGVRQPTLTIEEILAGLGLDGDTGDQRPATDFLGAAYSGGLDIPKQSSQRSGAGDFRRNRALDRQVAF